MEARQILGLVIAAIVVVLIRVQLVAEVNASKKSQRVTQMIMALSTAEEHMSAAAAERPFDPDGARAELETGSRIIEAGDKLLREMGSATRTYGLKIYLKAARDARDALEQRLEEHENAD